MPFLIALQKLTKKWLMKIKKLLCSEISLFPGHMKTLLTRSTLVFTVMFLSAIGGARLEDHRLTSPGSDNTLTIFRAIGMTIN